jgi:hypothetical protein
MICHGPKIASLVSQDPFADQPMRSDLVRFVSVLGRQRSMPLLPVRFPRTGPWLPKILVRDHRFVFGVYRRNMQVIGHLGRLDRLFGVPVTTRNWSTITAIPKVLDEGVSNRRGR